MFKDLDLQWHGQTGFERGAPDAGLALDEVVLGVGEGLEVRDHHLRECQALRDGSDHLASSRVGVVVVPILFKLGVRDWLFGGSSIEVSRRTRTGGSCRASRC